jgi:hypothetical protein
VLSGTAARFAEQAVTGRERRPPAMLLREIDRALDVAVALPGPKGRDLLLQLVGIRRGLFADAAAYRPGRLADDVSPVGAA